MRRPACKLLSIALTALAVGDIHALGLGEIVLRSRLGEPLHAEITLEISDGEEPAAHCFALLPSRDGQMPFLGDGGVRVVQRGGAFFLVVHGRRALNEPIAGLSVQVGCGSALQRDYVLLPEPALPVLPRTLSGEPDIRLEGERRVWIAREGDRLIDIAVHQARSPREEARLLAALRRAHPGLRADSPLAAGQVIAIPPHVAAAPTRPRTAAAGSAAAVPKLPPPPSGRAPRSQRPEPPPGDRLVLAAASERLPDGSPASALADLATMDKRMAHSEDELGRMRREIEQMDAAIERLARAIRESAELQAARPAAVLPAPASARAAADGTGWLALCLSALLGGGVVFGLTQLVERWRARRQFAAGSPAGERPVPSAEDIDWQALAQSVPTASPIEVAEDDDKAVLRLTELLLDQGRIRGAADVLADHLAACAPRDFQLWGMLLDLYRRAGMREEFQGLALRIHHRFNVEIVPWERSENPVSGLHTLENYPHIVRYLVDHWGRQDAADFLWDIVHGTRAGTRHGFPLEVLVEILLLLRILEDGHALQHSETPRIASGRQSASPLTARAA